MGLAIFWSCMRILTFSGAGRFAKIFRLFLLAANIFSIPLFTSHFLSPSLVQPMTVQNAGKDFFVETDFIHQMP